MFRVGNDWLCESCFDEDYVRCADCDRILRRDRAYWDDDDAYCSSCWDDHRSVIHGYSYTPDLVFHGKGLRHFGVELESDGGGTDRYNAEKLLNIANADAENLYIKTDGSLDDGLELITHPMTLEYHLNEMPWAAVLRKAGARLSQPRRRNLRTARSYLTNSDTVEIRMFRDTLKLNTLKATLQMVNHLCEVAVSLSDSEVQDMSWFDFLDTVHEPEFIQYLKERRLYVNEPVNVSEEE